MSQSKALELANRWFSVPGCSYSFGLALVDRLVSDWNGARGNMYSPIGVLISRIEAAMLHPGSAQPNLSQFYSVKAAPKRMNKQPQPKLQKSLYRKSYSSSDQVKVQPGTAVSKESLNDLIATSSPEAQGRENFVQAQSSEEESQHYLNKSSQASDKPLFDDLYLQEIWERTLERLNTRLSHNKLQVLSGSRLLFSSGKEAAPILELTNEWQTRQLYEADRTTIRLTLRQFLGESAWKLTFTSSDAI